MRRDGAWLGALGLTLLLTVGCQETGARPTAIVNAPDTADQVMEGFSHYVTDNGVQRSRVEADTAFFYEAQQSNELRQVRVTFFDTRGAESSTLTSKRARYRWQDGSMEAHDDVVVVAPDGRRLLTETLRYDKASNTIWTDKPFRFERGKDYLEGNSFRSDPDFRNVITDRPRGVAGEGILLPGQGDDDGPPTPAAPVKPKPVAPPATTDSAATDSAP